jgi:pimeloyl-ACP methyl ester carboxylesterase
VLRAGDAALVAAQIDFGIESAVTLTLSAAKPITPIMTPITVGFAALNPRYALSVPGLVPEFRKLTIPVLGVCGARDPYPDQPEVLRGMVGFREAPQIPSAARFVHWEKPAEFNAAVRAFVRTLA